jgi:catechol 2,3-dioxygenase-like lactoylglutathione lyase family enzyme
MTSRTPGRSILRRTPLAAVLIAILASGAPHGRAAETLAPAVLTVGFTVSDVDRAQAFFRDVLTFERVSERELTGRPFELLQGVFGLRARVVSMRLGGETVELTEYLAPRGRPIPPDVRSHDRSFQHAAIIVSDMDAAYARLRANRVQHASTGPQTLPPSIPAAAGIRAFYFRDPDGHFLEVLQFPPDKGPSRWHRTDRLFLGIDHTAIVVADTEASLRFYRDTLGLTIAGTSENFGVEQEHLNNVFGARLRITTLRAADGPGIELLQYLAPSDGRPAPADLRANDVLYWQTTIDMAMPEAAERDLVAARAALVSPGLVEVPAGDAGFSKGLLARDPDGHAVRIVSSAPLNRRVDPGDPPDTQKQEPDEAGSPKTGDRPSNVRIHP